MYKLKLKRFFSILLAVSIILTMFTGLFSVQAGAETVTYGGETTTSDVTVNTEQSIPSDTLRVHIGNQTHDIKVGSTFTVKKSVILPADYSVQCGKYALYFNSEYLTAIYTDELESEYSSSDLVASSVAGLTTDGRGIAAAYVAISYSKKNWLNADKDNFTTFTFEVKASGEITVEEEFEIGAFHSDSPTEIISNFNSGTYSTVVDYDIIEEKTLTGVSVHTAPTKADYYVGENLNTTGLQLQLTYSDNSTELVTTGFTTEGFDSATAGTKTITVIYEGETATFNVTVSERPQTLSEVSVYTNPTKTSYYIGENLNTTGLQLKLTYSDNSIGYVTTGFTTSNFDSTTAGTKTITVTYEGKTATFDVTVNAKPDIPSDTLRVNIGGGTYDIKVGNTFTVKKSVILPAGYSVQGGKYELYYDSEYLAAVYTNEADEEYVSTDLYASPVSGLMTDNKGISVAYVATKYSSKNWLNSNKDNFATFTFEAKASGEITIQEVFEIGTFHNSNSTEIIGNYDGGTYTTVVNCNIIEEKTLTGVSVHTAPTKTSYYVGDTLDTTGLQLQLTYSDNSTELVTTGFTTDGFDSATAGTQTITVTYEGETATFNVTVSERPQILSDVSIYTNPTKTSYYIGDTLDTEGLELKLTYSDNSIGYVTTGFTTSDFDSTTVGTKTITVTYGGKTATFDVTVNAKPDVPSDTLRVNIGGETYDIKVGDTFTVKKSVILPSGYSVQGGKYALYYNVEYLTAIYTDDPEYVSTDLYISPVSDLMTGDRGISVAYASSKYSKKNWLNTNKDNFATFTFVAEASGEITIEEVFEIGVFSVDKTTEPIEKFDGGTYTTVVDYSAEKTLSKVSVHTAPTKTSYDIGESLDTTGLQLELTYSDNSTELVTTGFTTEGFDSTATGVRTITVTYEDKTATFDVTIIKTLTSISVHTEPTKTSYDIGESLDTTGLQLELTYSDNSTELVTTDFTTEGFDSTATGVRTITVTYEGKTTTFDVTIIKTVSSISVHTEPTKTSYDIGESLDTTGLELEITYSDNSTEYVTTGFTTDGFDSATAGTKTITVTYEGKTATFDVTVNEPLKLGDMNGDGNVDSTDATLILQHYAGINTLQSKYVAKADLDGDNNIASTDATLVLQCYAGIISSFT